MQVIPIPLTRRFQRSGDLGPLLTPVDTPAIETTDPVVAGAPRRDARRIEGVGLGSVAATAAIVFGAVFSAVSMGILVLWVTASTTGTVGQFEAFMQSVGFRDFAVSGQRVVFGVIATAAALTLLATAFAVITAGLYNAIASTGHGLKVRISPEPAPALDLAADKDSPHAA